MVLVLLNFLATGTLLSLDSPLPPYFFFSFPPICFIRLLLCAFSPLFLKPYHSCERKAVGSDWGCSGGTGATFGPVLSYPLKVAEGAVTVRFDPRFFIFTRKEPKDGVVHVNSCPR